MDLPTPPKAYPELQAIKSLRFDSGSPSFFGHRCTVHGGSRYKNVYLGEPGDWGRGGSADWKVAVRAFIREHVTIPLWCYDWVNLPLRLCRANCDICGANISASRVRPAQSSRWLSNLHLVCSAECLDAWYARCVLMGLDIGRENFVVRSRTKGRISYLSMGPDDEVHECAIPTTCLQVLSASDLGLDNP